MSFETSLGKTSPPLERFEKTNGFDSKHTAVDSSPDGYVGYSNVPNQIHRKTVRLGFVFNILIVGPSGTGKSTFVNSLLMANFYSDVCEPISKRIGKTMAVERHSVSLKENGVSLRLNLIDTPGFGDFINNADCWLPVVDYIDRAFDQFMQAENKVEREAALLPDNRVHACLYFIPPRVHGLSELDVACLRALQAKVNLIPILAKADSMTRDELAAFKANVDRDLAAHGIAAYQFADLDEANQGKRPAGPFSVIGASHMVTTAEGRRVRARQYPWGCVEIENNDHCDFTRLRHLLLSVNLQHLKDVTHQKHYGLYRAGVMSACAKDSNFPVESGLDPMLLMDSERREHERRQAKAEAEMEAVFEQKVREKTEKMAAYEREKMAEMERLEEQLGQEELELDRLRNEFEAERLDWEKQQQQAEEGGGAPLANGGLGDRVMSEVLREKSRTKKRGLF